MTPDFLAWVRASGIDITWENVDEHLYVDAVHEYSGEPPITIAHPVQVTVRRRGHVVQGIAMPRGFAWWRPWDRRRERLWFDRPKTWDRLLVELVAAGL